MNELHVDENLMQRMVRAVEKVRERMLRAVQALETAEIPYAVVGGNAMAAWVATIDEAAVRNTPNVDVLLRRADLEVAKGVFAIAGFVFRHIQGIDMFLDGPNAKDRDAVHILFAGAKVRPADLFPTPDVSESDRVSTFRVVALEPLVRMKLTSFRREDRMHVRDMLDVGLVDATWLARLPEALSARLKELLDDPDG